MNMQLLSVNSIRENEAKCRPKISFRGKWLPAMGFNPGVLVQAVPVPNGMNFTLCDENIHRYSDLTNGAKEQGGRMVQVILNTDRKSKGGKIPSLTITGQYIYNGGLSIGDSLIIQYGYGVIRARKIHIDYDTKIIPMGAVPDKYTGQPTPKLRIRGNWLAEYGFRPDALSTVSACPGSVTFTLQDKPYTELIPYARRNRMKVVQVRVESDNGKKTPYIGTTGSCVSTAGFGLKDMLAATCGPGFIQVRKLELETLGFDGQLEGPCLIT